MADRFFLPEKRLVKELKALLIISDDPWLNMLAAAVPMAPPAPLTSALEKSASAAAADSDWPGREGCAAECVFTDGDPAGAGLNISDTIAVTNGATSLFTVGSTCE